MPTRNRKAFTMIELVFVVVVIGILAAIAVPKFAVTRNDSVNTKGKTILAAVRNSISAERQRRILRGDFLPIT
ncbi:MAG TPA: type II secretion system protein, partial [Sulfurovum sp.]|nr:type II secretion system protein [Sulfurovum sp.]